MKKFLFLLGLTLGLICLSGVTSRAQDLIVKVDGTEIEVYVDEVSEDLVQYRRYDNPSGPTYKLSLTSIARIEYESGLVEEYNTNPVEEPPVLSDEEKEEQERLEREKQKKIEEGKRRLEKELKRQEKEQKRQERKRKNQQNGVGFSFGGFMNWEILDSKMYGAASESLSYSGLRPSFFLDYHFASWIYLGVNGSYSIRSAAKNYTTSFAQTNHLEFAYNAHNIGVNGHLGLQLPFSSRKMGISVYAGPTYSWNIRRDANYSINDTESALVVPYQQMDMTVGVKIKAIVCLAAEYHIPLGAMDEAHIGIPAYYWSFGVGFGF